MNMPCVVEYTSGSKDDNPGFEETRTSTIQHQASLRLGIALPFLLVQLHAGTGPAYPLPTPLRPVLQLLSALNFKIKSRLVEH